MNYQIYNFQPQDFLLLKDPTGPLEGFNETTMKDFWNLYFKVNFLKYLNRNSTPSFNLPAQSFSFINPLLQKSVMNMKFDLYDKFAIINIQPDFKSKEIILLLKEYI